MKSKKAWCVYSDSIPGVILWDGNYFNSDMALGSLDLASRRFPSCKFKVINAARSDIPGIDACHAVMIKDAPKVLGLHDCLNGN